MNREYEIENFYFKIKSNVHIFVISRGMLELTETRYNYIVEILKLLKFVYSFDNPLNCIKFA